jgi:predicted phosphoadenosine phosphosulfate sulfurtransferase
MSFKQYTGTNVLEEARKRISYIFDEFENIIVSISGGKDSTVMAHLALVEAHKRGRKIGLFFLDEEVMYKATIEQVEYLMSLYPENTTRFWLQIPFNLTNSSSLEQGQVNCWDIKDKPRWMHKRSKNNICVQPWSHETKVADKNKGFGYYDVISNFELMTKNTAHLVGLRADESLNRYRAIIKNPGYKDIYWSTKRNNNGNYAFYPLYDWSFNDIWKYIGETGIRYHKYYDFCFLKGVPAHAMRVSSLTHEKSFKSIADLPEFEPDTYDKLLKRIKGISFAQETAKNKKMFKVQKLPKAYKSWREYRDFLLETYPDKSKIGIFKRRFVHHLDNDYVARQQCRQLVLNDYENNLPVDNREDPIITKVKYWLEVL